MRRFRRTLQLGCLLAGLSACNENSQDLDNKPPPPTPPLETNPHTGSDGAPDTPGVQSWGIGAKWYNYGANATVTPKDISWVVVIDDSNATHLKIDSFYGDEGESSKPSMTVTRMVDGQWQASEEWTSPTRIREEFQCIRFNDLDTTGCEASYDLKWRTDNRSIPSAGFSIPNPALYAETGRGERVYQLETSQIPSSLDDVISNGLRIRSVLDDDATPVIEQKFFQDTENSLLQLTGNMRLVEWRVQEEADELHFEARCIPVTPSAATTGTLNEPPSSLHIPVPHEEGWSFIQFCNVEDGPNLMHEQVDLRAGDWPSNAEFDLALRRKGEDLEIWTAPEGVFAPIRSTAFEELSPPAIFWAQ